MVYAYTDHLSMTWVQHVTPEVRSRWPSRSGVVDPAEGVQDLERRGLVEPAEGEPGMDDGVVADPEVGDARQAHVRGRAAVAQPAHRRAPDVPGVGEPAGHGEPHMAARSPREWTQGLGCERREDRRGGLRYGVAHGRRERRPVVELLRLHAEDHQPLG